ncbi:glycosyltransferase family 39 protein [Thioalkalicoccus limnaeus]|uniref:Glycosyltransferase family 39 protein n=1 Tax=Thioalkalicoccus limnaeus TaxID=120681 RepID=A0ABV4BLE0_9GAMM
MSPSAPPVASRSTILLIVGLLAYFSLFGVVRVLVSDALELDEAEQILLAQWWLWGYSDQPPLYTWLQAALSRWLGDQFIASVVLRQGLLLATYVFVYLAARKLLPSSQFAIAATLALMLIPQILWENQREHTHSLLVLALSAATLYQVFRLLERPTLAGYLVAGIFVGLGLLAKYNYLIFIAALLVALMTLPAGRRLLVDARTIAALVLVLAVTSPHWLWLWEHMAVGSSLLAKVTADPAETSLATGTFALVSTAILFVTPLWLIFVVSFWRALPERRAQDRPAPLVSLLNRYLLVVGLLLLWIVWMGDVHQVKERWLQPLLFVVPLWLFAQLDPARVPRQRVKVFSSLAIAAGLLALLVFGARVPLAGWTGDYGRLHLPVADLAEEIAARGFDGQLIVTDHYHLAGSLRSHLPDRMLYGPRDGYHLPRPADLAIGGAVLLVWDAARQQGIPMPLERIAQDAGWVLDERMPSFIEAPYRYSSHLRYRLAVLEVPVNQSSSDQGQDRGAGHGALGPRAGRP